MKILSISYYTSIPVFDSSKISKELDTKIMTNLNMPTVIMANVLWQMKRSPTHGVHTINEEIPTFFYLN